jgi:TatA/E family protein of Tat protein translocase
VPVVTLFILESFGTSEMILILVVALIFFGPRKLPQLSRQIGKSLAEFKKASEDFKRTWEREVALETATEPERESLIPPRETSVTEPTVGRAPYQPTIDEGYVAQVPDNSTSDSSVNDYPDPAPVNEPAESPSTPKREWL